MLDAVPETAADTLLQRTCNSLNALLCPRGKPGLRITSVVAGGLMKTTPRPPQCPKGGQLPLLKPRIFVESHPEPYGIKGELPNWGRKTPSP
jgi:hypothetical protein